MLFFQKQLHHLFLSNSQRLQGKTLHFPWCCLDRHQHLSVITLADFKKQMDINKKHYLLGFFIKGVDTARPFSSDRLWFGRSCKKNHPLAFSKAGAEQMELWTHWSSWSVEWDAAWVVGNWVELLKRSSLVVHRHPIYASSEGEGRK